LDKCLIMDIFKYNEYSFDLNIFSALYSYFAKSKAYECCSKMEKEYGGIILMIRDMGKIIIECFGVIQTYLAQRFVFFFF
jgi:hypothetical protein